MKSTDTTASYHGTADIVASTIELARTHGIAHELLTSAQIRARFPQFGPIRDNAVAYFEPEGGYVRPELCIAKQLEAAQALGATLITGATVAALESIDSAVRITMGERTLVADKVIVCAGMWSAGLLGEPFTRLLKVCRQKLFWFGLAEPSIFPAGSPSFMLVHGPGVADSCYGFPPIPGEGSMKIATEQYEELEEIEALDRTVSPLEAAEMYRTQVANHIAGLTPKVVKARVCTYTVTPDHGFIIDDHPTLSHVTVVSACSGHGFKHSAAIGEAVAQRCLTGKSEIDLSAFALNRFALNRFN